MTVFVLLAVTMTLATAALVLVPLLRNPAGPSPVAAALVALGIPALVLVSYLGASNYRWSSPPKPDQPVAVDSPEADGALADAIRDLEARMAANPEDLEGWILLGSTYTAVGRPEDALEAFRKALDLSGGRNLDARLGVAEAQLLLNRDAIAGEAGQTIEEVLAAAPANPKALWYGGMVALLRGEPALAQDRWQRLLALDPPRRIREIVEGELGRLAAMAGESTGGAAVAGTEEGAGTAAGIAIAVRLDESLRSQVRDGAPLFVFIRDGAGQGPPVAVVRRGAGELPLELVISDRDGMIPGRSLSDMNAAAIVARVANSGDPLPQPGDLYGEARWQPGDGPVQLLIDRRVE
jgi:cytochrome c-type biogenesis protein CcmH